MSGTCGSDTLQVFDEERCGELDLLPLPIGARTLAVRRAMWERVGVRGIMILVRQ
jgi:hypothetical protein